MMTILPVLLPLATAVWMLFWSAPSHSRRVVVALSAAVQLGIALYLTANVAATEMQVLYLGSWVAPYGITIVVDLLAAIMLCLSGLTALGATLFGYGEQLPQDEHPLRLPLLQFLVVGINLSFMTGDIFNLFVAFEVMLLASYALLTLEADDWDIREAFPYLAINLFGSALFLAACGFAYGLFGTLNMAQIAQRAAEMQAANGGQTPPLVAAWGLLLMLVFAIKAGVFPLYYWLPNSYPILPTAVSALYSGMLTKVGVYVLMRLMATILPHDLSFHHNLLAWLAAGTMVFGVLGAVSRNFIRGILSFHILSQIGFMVLAIGFFTPYAMAAATFYIVHHIIVKASLFMTGGVATFLCGSDDLRKASNLWVAAPVLGVVFFIQAMSLAGIPPLSGFWGKYMIIVEGMRLGEYLLVAASVVASVLTLFSMLKIWLAAYWKHDEAKQLNTNNGRWKFMTAVVGVMTLVSLVIGFGAEGFLQLAIQAGNELMTPTIYQEAVLGAVPLK